MQFLPLPNNSQQNSLAAFCYLTDVDGRGAKQASSVSMQLKIQVYRSPESPDLIDYMSFAPFFMLRASLWWFMLTNEDLGFKKV